jgi:hypothetical protein
LCLLKLEICISCTKLVNVEHDSIHSIFSLKVVWFAQPSKSWAFLCLQRMNWLSHIGVWRDWLVEINRASLQLSRLTLNPWSTESDSDADIADIRGQHFCLEVTLLGSV